MGWTSFLFAYLLGGLTFIPLALGAFLLHAYYSFPHRPDVEPTERPEDDIVRPGDDVTALRDAQKEPHDDSKSRFVDAAEVSAGYFAVCREYMPMGINAKPIERPTPVGSATVAPQSQSVYQAMYRSIFDRKQAPGPLDNNNNMSQRPKKAGNVFYVVLRHGHLMLFDDEEQLEVRHVVSLAHHDVSIYSGGDVTPEGELFIKKNAICLTRKTEGKEKSPVSKPFYLFSENCSAKEDFYFALLRNEEQSLAEEPTPVPLQFDVKNMISLVEKLHRSDDHGHARWLNAMIGRIFLSIHKTKDLENLIREKLTKKISRVKRPAFLSHISIRDISTGDSPPYITNPRLKDLNVEGECVAEADVKYTGNFRIEVAATARIDLGTRFKAREVNLVLAVVVRKIEGHCLFKIKPPPSNRIWFTFQTMPKMEMTIEPIVSARQITYTVILRQIENRIKEVFAETLVMPFWDDVPFFRTEHKKWRGGIWEGDDSVVRSEDAETIAAQIGDVDALHQLEDQTDIADQTRPMEKSHSVPNIQGSGATGVLGRKTAPNQNGDKSAQASSTSVDTTGPSQFPASTRSSAEALVASDVAQGEQSTFKGKQLAEAAKATLAAVSGAGSQSNTPLSSPTTSTSDAQKVPSNASSSSSGNGSDGKTVLEDILTKHARRNTASSAGSADTASTKGSIKSSIKSQPGSISKAFFGRQDTSSTTASGSSTNTDGTPKRNTLQAVSNAAAQAKQWGWNALQKQRGARNGNGNGNGQNQPESRPPVDLNQPMGRGRPLPPPGIPLPPPDRKSVTQIQFPKRKQLPPPLLPGRSQSSFGSQNYSPPKSAGQHAPTKRPVPPPPLPKRRQSRAESGESSDVNMLVVAAPSDSEPSSPQAESRPGYAHPTVEDAVDEGEQLKVNSPSTTSEAQTPRGSVSQQRSEAGRDFKSVAHDDEPGTPMTALPAEDAESDDGYSGWIDESNFEMDVPKETNTVAHGR